MEFLSVLSLRSALTLSSTQERALNKPYSLNKHFPHRVPGPIMDFHNTLHLRVNAATLQPLSAKFGSTAAAGGRPEEVRRQLLVSPGKGLKVLVVRVRLPKGCGKSTVGGCDAAVSAAPCDGPAPMCGIPLCMPAHQGCTRELFTHTASCYGIVMPAA